MSVVTWSFPTTIVFGNGAIASIADHVKRVRATRALLVCDAGVVKAEIADRVRRALEGAQIPTLVFDRVDPNPVEQNIVDGVAAFRSHGADIVVDDLAELLDHS